MFYSDKCFVLSRLVIAAVEPIYKVQLISEMKMGLNYSTISSVAL